MRLRFKIVIFFIAYSVVFYLFRNSDYFNYRFLAANLDSIPWLYSTIGLIFGVLSAFIIQKEWQQWNDLVDSVKGEVSALRELWFWAGHLPKKMRDTIQKSIKSYLNSMINEGWRKTEQGEISDELEVAIKQLSDSVSEMDGEQPILTSITFSLLSNIVNYRERRIRYGSSHMPYILLYTFRLATFLIIFLCPLIVVKAIELHYIFSISIALLAYTIYIVIYDLDHPLHPGGWHLTTIDYKRLLEKINQS